MSSESFVNEILPPLFTNTLLQVLASVVHAPVKSAPLPSRTFEYLDATADGMIALPRGAARLPRSVFVGRILTFMAGAEAERELLGVGHV